MLDADAAAARDAAMREAAKGGQHGTAADLIPAIASGIVATGTPGAGERFIQPRVGGELLDDVTGGGWRLFTRAPAKGGDVTVVDIAELNDGGAVADWLAARQAEAVLVRPDHYVFGTGTPSDLIALRAELVAGAAEQEIAA
jgi:3-(3-hydroxy-phenyl)propionate hydroxylase